MNTFSTLLVFASILVAAHSTTLRGTFNDQQSISHRRLEESTCTLYKKCVTYLPTKEHPNGYHKDTWACELSNEDSEKMGVRFVDIVETDYVAARIGNAVSGEATLTMSEAIVDTNSPRMFIPHDASMIIKSNASLEDGRRLASKPAKTGTLNTLVIRLLDNNNLAPTLSNAKLQNDVFYDNSSLKTQTAACSYNKLQIQPFSGKTPSNKQITNGVVDVKMDYTMGSGASGLDQAAMKAAQEQLGDLYDSMFDLIMFCFPPGNDFIAFAYPNTKFSFYNDKYCGYVGAQMHEVGHNLGLGHSGENGEGEYNDVTGFMGAPPLQDDLQMCYNPQKSYQLGWYDDKVESINPLDGVGKREYILNGVANYQKNNNALVVLRLEQSQLQTSLQVQQDFYVGFNHAKGINAQVAEDKDKVTIVRKDYGMPDQYAQSTKVASLSPGERATLENFNGERDVEIKFIGITNGDAKIIVNDPSLPAPNPPKCSTHTVEIKTDNYPGDTSWKIVDQQENIVAEGSRYEEKKKLYTVDVCLTDGQNYEFRVNDSYGDGLCCSQGEGYYRVTNECGGELVHGGNKDENFKERKHEFTAKCSSNPTPPEPTNKPTNKPTKMPTPKPTNAPIAKPTKSPTKSPTPPPPLSGSCEQYTVEIKTDGYPGDNSWYINDSSGNTKFNVDSFADAEKVYKTNVCLEYDSTYEFVMLDDWKDGMCCKHGDGYYKVKNSKGTIVLDSTKEEEKFEIRKKTIVVGSRDGGDPPAPPQAPTPPEAPVCQDKKEKFKLKNKNNNLRSCKFFANKNKCNKKVQSENVPVWKLCPVSCNRCDDI